VNTTATSGLYLGLDRATQPKINTSVITSGGTLDPAQILALKQLIEVNTGGAAPELLGLASPHQFAIMSRQVQTMQFFLRSQVTQAQIDPLPKMSDDGVLFGDVTHYKDLCQAADRIDYCDKKTWGRVYLDKPGADFYEDPLSGDKFFPMTASSTNAGYAAGSLFYLISTLNYYNVNPQFSGLISGLNTPTSDYGY